MPAIARKKHGHDGCSKACFMQKPAMLVVLAVSLCACTAGTGDNDRGDGEVAYSAPIITVLEATFGANVGAVSGNVTSRVAARCSGSSTCAYTVDPAQMFPPPPFCPGFADVSSGHIFCHYLATVRNHGVMPAPSGCSPGSFCPEDPVTRREAAAYIVRAAFGEGFSHPSAPYFDDVGPGDPFFRYVQKLREQGITSGCATRSYEAACDRPQLTRGQMAVFLMRAKYGEQAGGPERFTAPAAQMFTDVPPTHMFYRYIQQLAALGITSGTSATEFSPDALITKGQMAVFVARTFFAGEVPAGNPLASRPKDFTVRYVCSGGATSTVYLPANAVGQTAMLTCASAGEPITIVSATYGEDEGAPQGNATWDVGPACNGRTTCDYLVNPFRIGDPAPGAAKMFGVRYRCGSSPLEIQTGVAQDAQWRTLHISCMGSPPEPESHAQHDAYLDTPQLQAPPVISECSGFIGSGSVVSPLEAARAFMEPLPELDWDWVSPETLEMAIRFRGESAPFMRISGPFLRIVTWVDWERLTLGQAFTGAEAIALGTSLAIPGWGEVVLVGVVGGILIYAIAQQIIKLRNESRRANPLRGAPGSESATDTEDGRPKQVRRYGPDGYPETDVDYDHDHGQGQPHAHDWSRPGGGGPPSHLDRQPGRPVQPSDPRHPRAP